MPFTKPKSTLSLTAAVMTQQEIVTKRKDMWDGWIDQCVMAQEALIEGILFQIPGARGDE